MSKQNISSADVTRSTYFALKWTSFVKLWVRGVVLALVGSIGVVSLVHADHDDSSHYGTSTSATNKVKAAPICNKPEIPPDRGAPVDEAVGCRTLQGTPVASRTYHDYPAEQQDRFDQMDKVVSSTTGQLGPLDFDLNGDGIDDAERNAIRGRNTWILWGGGNEAFWNWLQQDAYGIVDFLVLLDSRERGRRFRDKGLINQPGFEPVKPSESEGGNRKARIEGLWLDRQPEDERTKNPNPICKGFGEASDEWVKREEAGAGYFIPYDARAVANVRCKLGYDQVSPLVYGYPSGVVGLRLFLNPDFYANTREAEKARALWDERVVSRNDDAFYVSPAVNSDPKLVRPFRVAMTCGFCHVGPHPLLPPTDPENPSWENLSSIIGDQWWNPQPSLGNLLTRDNFLHHFLRSQAPGTIDTSLISTDQINNANTINAIFDVPARLDRAGWKPRPYHYGINQPEKQSATNLLMGSAEDGDGSVNPRHTPRVLLDGADSIGVLGALIRVPINIGTFPEMWLTTDNPVIGFTGQTPFNVAAAQKNSVYWQANEKERVPYMAQFFTLVNDRAGQNSTQPMKLRDTELGKTIVEAERGAAVKGREVFIDNCAICHSSKQPVGFELQFSRVATGGDWKTVRAPAAGSATYLLPAEFAHWDDYKLSPAYADYKAKIHAIAGDAGAGDDAFIKDNFLSSEVRIPITLVGTNSGRAAATNAKRGQVWDNFSSDTYKALPAVGAVRYFNPFSNVTLDAYGNNDQYELDGGGPGYYRPASLISLWATSPYLHNNTLGVLDPVLDAQSGTHSEFVDRYLAERLKGKDNRESESLDLRPNPTTVESRLAGFDDGIRKLLWKDRRNKPGATYSSQPSPGDLRPIGAKASAADPGMIYRVPQDTFLQFTAPFIRPLIASVAGPVITSVLATWIWVAITLVLVIAAIVNRRRHAGVLLLVAGLFLLLLLVLAHTGPHQGASAASVLSSVGRIIGLGAPIWWLVALALGGGGIAFLYFTSEKSRAPRILFSLLAATTLVVGILAHRFINGDGGPLRVGPIPYGVPVNLVMNIDPEKPTKLPKAIVSLVAGMVRVEREQLEGDAAYAAFVDEAGPALLEASKCPDFVLDRGHWFGEQLTEDEKAQLMAFLLTL